MGIGPAFHRFGPLLGQVVVRQPLERAHELAVHDPRRQRVEVARGGRRPRLVEQRQPSVDLSVEDQQARLGYPADGGSGRVALGADFDGSTRPGRRLCGSPLSIRS